MAKEMINDLGVVLAAGGSGSRFSDDPAVSKLFASSRSVAERYTETNGGNPAEFADIPLFIFSVITFAPLCSPGAFVVAAKSADIPLFEKVLLRLPEKQRPTIVPGGKTRAESVLNGLRSLPESANFAAVHDAARPFATKRLLLDCLQAARLHGGAVAAKRVTDTVKRSDSDGFVIETLDRKNLWRIETPQVFKTRELRNAYERALNSGFHPTDDAGAMESLGHRPFLVESPAENTKITFQHDLTGETT